VFFLVAISFVYGKSNSAINWLEKPVSEMISDASQHAGADYIQILKFASHV